MTKIHTSSIHSSRKQLRPRLAILQPADDVNRVLQQSDEAGEPSDDDFRDPRQTEQWIPVPMVEPDAPKPLTDRQRHRKMVFPNPEDRREFLQWAWDARKEHNALAADADARGVLNYYNINRSPRLPYHDRGWEGAQEMEAKDIANVEFLQFGDLDGILGDLIDVSEAQHEMEDLNCRWNATPEKRCVDHCIG